MIRRLALLPLLLAGCAPPGSVDRLSLEYQVGEELMIACTERGERCAEWLEFKRGWEEGVSYMTTFEKSLAQHKARVAAGGAV
ncbi:hypothetical protein [Rhodovulum marinum]|uniref:Lipoprotein n=1 Tax=Rhodovulum marinum TaxID=320662 RepID=A0A4R2Q5A8_9RHOB|nr:hypothetical protein [Rhodovulum marinum]TCP43962.1 hypothetical protein EV662_10147 [Rhodovulum marinum]